MSVHIQIEQFEGPLGLLLHLIRREEMDIFDINIHDITKQYLEYIKAMKKLDLEVAGEFVAMAATLIQIKSRMLLPSYNEDGEEIETEDPRKVLVQKLLDYQKFQEAGQKLYDRPLLGRDVWKRGERLKVANDKEEEIIVEEENALFALIKAYRYAIKNMRKKVHTVVKSMQSITDRIREVRHLLTVGKTHRMSDLLSHEEKNNTDKILITFLTMLELAKVGLVSLFQQETFGDLYIEAKKPIVDDALSRVEDYDDGGDKEDRARALFDEAESEASEKALKEEAHEEHQLELGQLPEQDDVDDGDDVEAATDDEIFAEEQKILAEEVSEHMGEAYGFKLDSVESPEEILSRLDESFNTQDENLGDLESNQGEGLEAAEAHTGDVLEASEEDSLVSELVNPGAVLNEDDLTDDMDDIANVPAVEAEGIRSDQVVSSESLDQEFFVEGEAKEDKESGQNEGLV